MYEDVDSEGHIAPETNIAAFAAQNTIAADETIIPDRHTFVSIAFCIQDDIIINHYSMAQANLVTVPNHDVPPE
jgi:hypothetical protein